MSLAVLFWSYYAIGTGVLNQIATWQRAGLPLRGIANQTEIWDPG
jgi:hypothetical protein